MKDRIPKKPNRYKLLHMATGAEEQVYLERDDEPLVPGTPLNTATLMSDKVSALYGLSVNESTPSQALDKLADHIETVVNPGFETDPEAAYLPANEKVVYVDDTGGDTAAGTQSAPLKTLQKALAVLGADGGTVRIVSKVTFSLPVAPTTHGAVLIEGLTSASTLCISGTSYPCRGDTAFRGLTIKVTKNYTYINGMGYRLGILKGVKTVLADGVTSKLSIRGGGDACNPQSTHVAVFSGTWGTVYGGTSSTVSNPASIEKDTVVAIYGGDIGKVSGGNNVQANASMGTFGGRRFVLLNGVSTMVDNERDVLIQSSSGGYISGDLILHTGNVKCHIGHKDFVNGEKLRNIVMNGSFTVTHKLSVGTPEMPQRNLVVYTYGDMACEPYGSAEVGDNYKITAYGRITGEGIPTVSDETCRKVEYRASVVDDEYASGDVTLPAESPVWKWTATPLDGKTPLRARTVFGAFGLGKGSDGASLVISDYAELADIKVGDTLCDVNSGCVFTVATVGTVSVTVEIASRLPNERAWLYALGGEQTASAVIGGTDCEDMVLGDVVYDDTAFALYRCVAIGTQTVNGEQKLSASFVKIMDLPNSSNITLKGYRKRNYVPITETDSINTAFGKLEGRVAEIANAIFTANNKLVYTFSPDESETFSPPFNGTYDIYAVGGGGDGVGTKGGGGGGVGLLSSYTLTKGETYTITKTANGITLTDSAGSTIISATNGTNATASGVGTGGSASGVTGVTVYAGTAGSGKNGGSVSESLISHEAYVAGKDSDWYAAAYRTINYKGGAGIFGEQAGLPGYAKVQHTGSDIASGYQTYTYHYSFPVAASQTPPEGAGKGGECQKTSIPSRSWTSNRGMMDTYDDAVQYVEDYSGGIGGSGYGGGGSGAASSGGYAGKGARACVHIESVSLEVESTEDPDAGLMGDETGKFKKIGYTNDCDFVVSSSAGGKAAFELAIDSANDGDTILVMPGEYGGTGRLDITKNLNFLGVGMPEIKFSVNVGSAASGDAYTFYTANFNGFALTSVTVDADTNNYSGVSKANLYNCRITGSAGIAGTAANTLFAGGLTSVTFASSQYIYNCRILKFDFDMSASCVVEGCDITVKDTATGSITPTYGGIYRSCVVRLPSGVTAISGLDEITNCTFISSASVTVAARDGGTKSGNTLITAATV